MYSRFKALKGFGDEELEKLRNSKVAVIGLGATGSVIAEHLARHGIPLLIVDRDYLEPNDVYSSNIYAPKQCEEALPKAVAAKEYLGKFAKIEAEVESLKPENIGKLEDVDLIIDGSDNLETRFLINEFSQRENIPWIYTAAIGQEGYSMFFDSKCFSCVFENVSAGSLETCETAGILREASTIAASITAEKAVKYLAGKDLDESLDTVSGENFSVESSGCEICGGESYPRLNSSSQTVAVCGENKYQVEKEINDEAFERLKNQADRILVQNSYLLRASIDDRELTAFESGRIILEAEDKGHAEAVVSEILGI